MALRHAVVIAALLAASPIAATAAEPAAPSKAQLENAARVLQIVASALQAEQVEQPIKNRLFECLYSNSVSKVSEATEKVIAANPGKIDRKNPSQMLAVIAGVCGYRPTAGATPAPKK